MLRGHRGWLVFCLALASTAQSARVAPPPRAAAPPTVTASTVWPAPASIVGSPPARGRGGMDKASHTALRIIPAQFVISAAAGNSSLLVDVIERLRATTFAAGGDRGGGGSPAGAATRRPLLRRLDVYVGVEAEPGYPSSTSNEAYTLSVTGAMATIHSAEVWGAIRALQSFSQLVCYNFSSASFSINTTHITDGPRFPHRGLMIDTARRFYPVATILTVMDGMEASKLNVLHCDNTSNLRHSLISRGYLWIRGHATDNEAFPLVLVGTPPPHRNMMSRDISLTACLRLYVQPSRPELAAAGAWTAHGHRYSIADIKLIVSEARRRAIRVIVEFDTPGHVGGFCRSHDTCVWYNQPSTWPAGATGCLLDPSKPQTWSLLNSTFSDLMDLFPDEMLMIGGDGDVSHWEHESEILAWAKQHGYTSGQPGPWIGNFFSRWLGELLATRGRRAVTWMPGVADDNDAVRLKMLYNVDIGWSNFGPTATGPNFGPQVWQSRLAEYTAKGLDVVLSAPWYITKADGRGHCELLDDITRCPVSSDWAEFYSIDPQNFSGSATQMAHVKGGECTAWNDNTLLDASTLLGALFPVCSAMAEVLWSPAHTTSNGTSKFTFERLVDHRCTLNARGIPASVPNNKPAGVGWGGDVGFCPEEFTI